jgi:lysophospholipase L1-like esterase
MKEKSKIIVLIVVALLGVSSMATKTIHFIGDSTMADYDTTTYPNQRGWGQMFRNFITGDVSFVNAARNGRSSKSFYTEGLWSSVLANVNEGDYVFIQFAHNDEKSNGVESSSATTSIDPSGVGTAPWGDYVNYLTKYVNETRAKGAIPILVTPIVRRYFDGSSITCKGAHDLSSSTATTVDDSTLNYVRAMKSVARTLNVTLIDHTALTKALAESYGATDAKSIIYVSTDDTHLQPIGATLYAKLVVQELLKKGILVDTLTASPEIVVSPTTLSFGNCYVSTYSSKTLSVSGMSLTPDSGLVTITAPQGFTVSTSESGTFSSSLTLSYTKGTINATSVYVHFSPTEEKTYSDTITITGDSISTKKVPVTGTAIALSNGISSNVTFPLIADASSTVTGPLVSLGESWSGVYVKNYATMTTWPTGAVTTNKTQRNIIIGDAWPAEIDIVSTRYVQFGIKTSSGTIFTLDTIGLYAGASGGSGMCFRIMYSTDSTFNNATTLTNSTSNTSGAMTAYSYNPILQISDSSAFYLRIYPWYSSAAASKYLCLQNLYLGGKVSTTSAITDASASPEVKLYPNPAKNSLNFENVTNNTSVELYNVNGVHVANYLVTPQKQSIDISTIPAGVYLLKIKNNNRVYQQKVIKE